ncbi:Type I restriction-modification system,specificity subunit S [Candidatus Phaeomarinobacter ectocarpi]|uniref:Type I restriction-modification system,specificity subunit S n=1 Tax=Candidatus Phaeomarinibacter ectocarpi TaxID=1458461 RepID=X5MDL5_9HYPH|nr:restriction endonuclease subunit S [Candidatus Phaeomarinobacter ectocarpi]CDO60272.1 Type I restriction-modification system,specificity subunit S [Candidatus Phaeomarinobacter ectocarpi]
MSWASAKIGDIAEVVTKGTTPTTYGMPFTDSGVNFIKAEALNGDTSLDRSGFTFVSESTHEKLKRSILNEHDVLLTIAGAQVGRCGFVRAAHLPANTNQAVGIVRVKRECAHPAFVYYYFKNPLTFQKFQGLGGQAAQPNINLTMLKGVELPLPDIRTQDAIVEILSAYDDLIETNRRRIALLEEAARMLYREWFVYFRFPSHEHIKITDGLPEGWERRTLDKIAENNCESYRAKELPEEIDYIDISSVAHGSVVSKTRMPAVEAPGRARRKVRDGDVIWSNVRPNLRAYALILDPDDLDVVSTGFTVLSASLVPFSWLYMFVTTDSFVGHLINHATGVGYPAVRSDDFERAEVLLPPKALLDHFHEATEPNLRLIRKLDQQNQKLAQARDLLLPRLMNGEIAV